MVFYVFNRLLFENTMPGGFGTLEMMKEQIEYFSILQEI